MIYLDNAASSPVHPEVLDVMLPYLKEQYGNPSSIHGRGRAAKKALAEARRHVAGLINAHYSEILFTSGGTESNNTALYGIAERAKGGRIITTMIEHEAVLEPCAHLEEKGFEVVRLRAGSDGLISAGDFEDAVTDDTIMASVMMANNEVGTVQPISNIARICGAHHITLHTDAVQAAGKIPIDAVQLGADLISISSHKINGPKGAGALYIRRGLGLDPLILGGGQEGGMRSGTESVACIAGFGAACKIASENIINNGAHLARLRDRLLKRIIDEIPHVIHNGSRESELPNCAHLTFLGVNGEDLIIKLDECGVAASTGSACSVNRQKASHVLEAMGFSHEQITGSLRLSVGIRNTDAEIDDAARILAGIVSDLRRVSPLREKYGFSSRQV